jgi:hypothetical protein
MQAVLHSVGYLPKWDALNVVGCSECMLLCMQWDTVHPAPSKHQRSQVKFLLSCVQSSRPSPFFLSSTSCLNTDIQVQYKTKLRDWRSHINRRKREVKSQSTADKTVTSELRQDKVPLVYGLWPQLKVNKFTLPIFWP